MFVAAGHILDFHIGDWLSPNGEPMTGRGMMGDGVIDRRRIRRDSDATEYSGAIEVEIVNQESWDRPGLDVLRLLRERYRAVM